MAEFWEEAFRDKKEMWGTESAKSTLIARDVFLDNKVKKVLIPGIGYGRNAKAFLDSGMTVTGIEISQTAIELAKARYGNKIHLHHGSVTEMPFDEELYDGIFCYGLIYLLDEVERIKLIRDCYAQLRENGVMLFTAITKEAKTYGQGIEIGKDRFEMFGGVRIFFYDIESIQEAFGNFGLLEIIEVQENYPFYLVKCRK